MANRCTTRLTEPVKKLIAAKASKEKKSISEIIAEIVSAAAFSYGECESDSLAKSVSDLSTSFSILRKEFAAHREASDREFRMIFNILILQNELSKHLMPMDKYEEAWRKYDKKHDEYQSTGKISL
ncbi:MAG: hypothetical protein NTV58_03805 [Deltaproteobacteria bacterium]|nr:hypothetical protein [Deltaproteobacteria bacterium]